MRKDLEQQLSRLHSQLELDKANEERAAQEDLEDLKWAYAFFQGVDKILLAHFLRIVYIFTTSMLGQNLLFGHIKSCLDNVW